MNKIRLGKTISVKWKVNPTDATLLTKDELTLILECPDSIKRKINDFTCENNTLEFVLEGISFKTLGKYTLTLWRNKGISGQTVVDCVNAFTLVQYTSLEDREYCSCECFDLVTLDLESDIEITGGGVPGEPGFSPYINEDGYWVTKEGVTDVKAQGPQGEPGPAGTYTQGTGINIDNNILSVDTNTIQTKLTNTKTMTIEYEDGSTESIIIYIQ